MGLELMWPGARPTDAMNEIKNEGKQDDHREHRPTIVCGFHRSSEGTLGAAEACGKIHVGDHLIAVNDEPTVKRTFQDILEMIKKSDRPLRMKFREWGRYNVGELEDQEGEGGKKEEDDNVARTGTSTKATLAKQCCKTSLKLKRYAQTWQYLWPGWILDKNTSSRSGKVWRIDVRLADIVCRVIQIARSYYVKVTQRDRNSALVHTGTFESFGSLLCRSFSSASLRVYQK